MKTTPLDIDLIFKAFADPTRLRILHLLTKGELCVCDIIATVRLPQSTVSRHLAYLRRAGLVRDRKEGLWKHYSLAAPDSRVHKSLLYCLKDCFREVDALKKDMEKFKGYQRTKCC